MDELLRYRSEFPILEQYTYMISHSLGAMPRAVFDRVKSYADLWNERGIQAWEDAWWEMPRLEGSSLKHIKCGSTVSESTHVLPYAGRTLFSHSPSHTD